MLEDYLFDNKISIQGVGDPFGRFPKSCCLSASILLGNLIRDIGFWNISLISGNEGEHYWLEIDNNIIDITYDQFPQIKQKVIIVDKTRSEFHLGYHTKKENLPQIRKDHHFNNILEALRSKLFVNGESKN